MRFESNPALRGGATIVGVLIMMYCGGCSKTPRPSPEITAKAARVVNDSGKENALVRVIAAIPGSPALDISADNQVMFPKLSYKMVTRYRELPDERLTFRVRPAGESLGSPLAENSKGLTSGKHYTLVAYGEGDGKAALAAFGDNLAPPEDGKAKVRLINAAPEIGEVDVYAVGRDTLFRGIDSGSESRYSEVDAMQVTLQIKPQGRENSLLSVENMRFEAGGIYTIVLVGRSAGTPGLTAIRIEDRLQDIPSARLLY